MHCILQEPKLPRYAAQGDWDLVPDWCKLHPKEAQFVHKYACMDTPLCHLLCTQGCSMCPSHIKEGIFQMKFAAMAALLDTNIED